MVTKRLPPELKRPLKPCGTVAAFNRHRRRGEPIDEPCRAAHAAERLAFYHRNAERVNRERRATRDYAAERAARRTRALIQKAERLAAEDACEALRLGHPGEYARLFEAARAERMAELFEALEARQGEGSGRDG